MVSCFFLGWLLMAGLAATAVTRPLWWSCGVRVAGGLVSEQGVVVAVAVH